jgi:hypothetical protein
VSSALHNSKEPIGGIRISIVGNTICSANKVFHEEEDLKEGNGSIAWDTSTLTKHGRLRRNDSVVACCGIIIEHDCIHPGLTHDIVGQPL